MNHALDREPSPRAARRSRTIRWICGAVLLAALVVFARHFSDACEFARLAERARPWWLLLAIAFQGLTYVSQGQIYRVVAAADGKTLGMLAAARLSITKLFVDQAIPSAGVSGTVAVAASLQQRGISRGIVSAGIFVDLTGIYVSYILCLVVSLASATGRGRASVVVLISALGLVLLLMGAIAFAITRGRTALAVPERIARLRFVRSTLDFVRDADPRLARSRAALLQSSACHLAILLCDAGTMWILVRAFGASAPVRAVFVSFFISNILRTVAILPGGLGTFEAVSVLTLHVVGVSVAPALAATLLFRGLSFWLPMLPGFWFWRDELRQHPSAELEGVAG
jgi:P-type Mg2+ transporter